MKNQIFNLGKALNKAEQKQINGGDPEYPNPSMCDVYVDQQSCEAVPTCVWGDYTWRGTGQESCKQPTPQH